VLPVLERSGAHEAKRRILHALLIVALGRGDLWFRLALPALSPTRCHRGELMPAHADEQESTTDGQHIVDPLTARSVGPGLGAARRTREGLRGEWAWCHAGRWSR
jgi:hypothetical protein